MEKGNFITNFGHKNTFAVFAILSSLLGLVFLITTLLQKPPLPDQVLTYFESNRGNFILFAVMSLVYSVITIPVIIAIGLLNKKNTNSGLSITAIMLTSSGVLLNGIVSFLYVGALLSISNAENIQGSNSAYEMSIWTNFFYFMTDPALLIWGLGQLILGSILLSNPTFPKWVGIITIIGGIAGVLTLVVYQTPILAILQELTLIILTSYFSLFLLRKNIV